MVNMYSCQIKYSNVSIEIAELLFYRRLYILQTTITVAKAFSRHPNINRTFLFIINLLPLSPPKFNPPANFFLHPHNTIHLYMLRF